MEKKLTPSMLKALEQIYRSPDDNEVERPTAYALRRRGLVEQKMRRAPDGRLEVLPDGSVKPAPHFPRFRLTFTDEGLAVCKARFGAETPKPIIAEIEELPGRAG